MARTGRIEVKISADTRALRRDLTRARLVLERSWRRRLALRFALWRIAREGRVKP
jgi:hypothetical protein